jgi:aminocarboxymuconate-semialdehyde decarboxylase
MKFDIHSHFFPLDAFRKATKHKDSAPRIALENSGRYSVFCQGRKRGSLLEGAYEPKARIRELDEMGIDMQALSPSPILLYYWDETDSAAYFARLQNEAIYAVSTEHSNRFVAFGTVPLQDVSEAIAVAEEAKRLGLCGLEIGTKIGSMYLDDSKFERFFEAIEDLDLFVLIHPIETAGDMNDGISESLSGVLRFPYETTVAIERMIIKGMFEKYRKLRICLAHGGGFLPYNIWRLDFAVSRRKEMSKNIAKKPSEYLEQIYFDSLVHSVAALEYLVKVVGSQRVMLGTDYPMGMGDRQSMLKINSLESLTKEERANILGNNAMNALKGIVFKK